MCPLLGQSGHRKLKPPCPFLTKADIGGSGLLPCKLITDFVSNRRTCQVRPATVISRIKVALYARRRNDVGGLIASVSQSGLAPLRRQFMLWLRLTR